MGRAMRSWLIRSSLVLLLFGLPVAAKAFDEDLHYNATFVLALSVGFSWEQALTIASADQAVDENLFTKPTEQAAWRSPAGKSEAVQWSLGPLTLGLSLQDYYFHCFSPEKDAPGHPHPLVIRHLEELEKKAVDLTEFSLKTKQPADEQSALIALGVYLHCQQDSWSHSGYGADPLRHTKDNIRGVSPDDTPRYRDNTTGALRDSIKELKAFATRLDRRLSDVGDAETDGLINGLLAEPGTADREECNRRIADYWLRKIADAHPSVDVTPSRRAQIAYSYTIGELTRETSDLPRKALKIDRVATLNAACIALFEKAFPEVLSQYDYKRSPMLNMTEVSNLAQLSMLRVPPKRSPLLQVTISVSPTFKKQPNSYDIFEK